jgi:hypothetical protein
MIFRNKAKDYILERSQRIDIKIKPNNKATLCGNLKNSYYL